MKVGIRVTAVSAAAVEQRHRTVDRYIDTAAVHAREKGEEVNEKRIFFFFSFTVFLLLNSLLPQFTPNNTCRYECPFFFLFFLFFSFLFATTVVGLENVKVTPLSLSQSLSF